MWLDFICLIIRMIAKWIKKKNLNTRKKGKIKYYSNSSYLISKENNVDEEIKP